MRRRIFILLVILLPFYSAKGQNSYFIGKKAYSCTPEITLQSNSELSNGYDLNVVIIKNGQSGMIAVSTDNTGEGVRIKGNILIYLDNNTIIPCVDRGKFDQVNNTTTTLYYLTKEEIKKMMESNINTIRFSLKCYSCIMATNEGNYSASNKGQFELVRSNTILGETSNYEEVKTDTPSLIKDLFNN